MFKRNGILARTYSLKRNRPPEFKSKTCTCSSSCALEVSLTVIPSYFQHWSHFIFLIIDCSGLPSTEGNTGRLMLFSDACFSPYVVCSLWHMPDAQAFTSGVEL